MTDNLDKIAFALDKAGEWGLTNPRDVKVLQEMRDEGPRLAADVAGLLGSARHVQGPAKAALRRLMGAMWVVREGNSYALSDRARRVLLGERAPSDVNPENPAHRQCETVDSEHMPIQRASIDQRYTGARVAQV